MRETRAAIVPRDDLDSRAILTAAAMYHGLQVRQLPGALVVFGDREWRIAWYASAAVFGLIYATRQCGEA